MKNALFPTFQLELARAETVVQETEKDTNSRSPHLMNLNEDPMLSGVLFHTIAGGVYNVGRKDGNPLPQLCLSGLRYVSFPKFITKIFEW